MKYMLDTNICIYLIKKHPLKTLHRLQQTDASDVCISTISVGELEYGIEKSQKRDLNRLALAEFLAPIEIFLSMKPRRHIMAEFVRSLSPKAEPSAPTTFRLPPMPSVVILSS
ncbi:MAG: PIN domain-containing protein [Chitinivibrionales bacterium]|nr:PIN domain-containing protein [Chitinivibrionales bacterium]